ncbi:AP-4 complex subunit sigma [Glycine max]|nr:AP-4 complex subunit sigma [Glycine max]RZC13812.1 AP-4 complex subunit sigma [Glycine soja]
MESVHLLSTATTELCIDAMHLCFSWLELMLTSFDLSLLQMSSYVTCLLDQNENQRNTQDVSLNELAILEFIHLLVETMDRHFGNVNELDIMFHLEKVHFMLEEIVMNGCIVETSKANILSPIQLLDKTS